MDRKLIPPVAEVLQHPAFPTALWKLEPDRSGLAPVAEGRGGPLRISWEVHGEGPIKLIFIMGLGGLKTAWQRQTMHFGHERRDRYSVLVFDNRGMGDSDKPLMRYSTSEMARDLAEVLGHIGWLSRPARRELHVVGLSMGGMIAQELACLLPEHVSTLSLCCTAAAIENTTTFAENMANRVSMLVPKTVDRSVADAALSIFSKSYLAEPDDARLPVPGETPKCRPPSVSSDTSSSCTPENGHDAQKVGGEYLRFPTNAHRFVAQEMHKRRDPVHFGVKGFLLQLIAAGWHHKSPAQLADMAGRVGRDRILVMHGTEDSMISPPHGRKLIDYIRPGVGLIVEGMGHAPLVERFEWFNNLIEERCLLGERLDGRA